MFGNIQIGFSTSFGVGLAPIVADRFHHRIWRLNSWRHVWFHRFRGGCLGKFKQHLPGTLNNRIFYWLFQFNDSKPLHIKWMFFSPNSHEKMDVSGTRYILKMQSYLFRFLRLFGCLLCLPWSQKSTNLADNGGPTLSAAILEEKPSESPDINGRIHPGRCTFSWYLYVSDQSISVKCQHVSTDTKNVSFLRIFSRLFNESFVWNCLSFFEDTALTPLRLKT